MTHPKIGHTVYFGTHLERGAVAYVPAIVGLVRPDELGDNGLPALDLYIFHAFRHENGWAGHVKGFDKLRVGGWSLSEESDPEALGTVEKSESRRPSDLIVPPDSPPMEQERDPQVDGMPNIFGGLTRYNPAVDRQQHSNANGDLLWICADGSHGPAGKWHWIVKGTPALSDGSCCANGMQRRLAGMQAHPSWDKWKPGEQPVAVAVPTHEGENVEADE